MERYHIFKLGLAILFYAAYCVRPLLVAAVEVEVIEDTTNKTDIVADDDYYVYYQGVEGKPGVDFPVLSYIPRTSFNCKHMESGYYADLETDCQVFHICEEGKKISFLCPNGTIFQQSDLICEWWFKVNCTNSPNLYTDSAEQLHEDQARRKSGRRVVDGHELGKHGAVMRLEEHSSVSATQNGRKYNVAQHEDNSRGSQQSDQNGKVRMRVVVHKKHRNDLAAEAKKDDSQIIKIQNDGSEQVHYEKKRISNRLDKKIQNNGLGSKSNASPVYKIDIQKDNNRKDYQQQNSSKSNDRFNYESQNYERQSTTNNNNNHQNNDQFVSKNFDNHNYNPVNNQQQYSDDLSKNNNQYGFAASAVSSNDLGAASTNRPQFNNNYNQYSTSQRSVAHDNGNHQKQHSKPTHRGQVKYQFNSDGSQEIKHPHKEDQNQYTSSNHKAKQTENYPQVTQSYKESKNYYSNSNQNIKQTENYPSTHKNIDSASKISYQSTPSSLKVQSSSINNFNTQNSYQSQDKQTENYPHVTHAYKESQNDYSNSNQNSKKTENYPTSQKNTESTSKLLYESTPSSIKVQSTNNFNTQNSYQSQEKHTESNPQVTNTYQDNQNYYSSSNHQTADHPSRHKNIESTSKISYQSTPSSLKVQNNYQSQVSSTLAPKIQSTFIQHFESEQSTDRNLQNSGTSTKNLNYNTRKSEIGKDTSIGVKNQQVVTPSRNDLLTKRVEATGDLEETQIPQESSSFLKHPFNTIQQDVKKTTNPYPNHRETYSDIKDPKIYSTEKFTAGISSVTPQYLTTQPINNGKPFIGSRVGVNVYAQPTTTPLPITEELFKSSYAYTVGEDNAEEQKSTTPVVYSKVSFGTKYPNNINVIQSTAEPFNVGKTDNTLPPVTTRTTVNVPLPTTEIFNIGRTDKTLNSIAVATNEPIIYRGSATTPKEGSFNTGVTGTNLNYGASINLGHSTRSHYQQNSVTPNTIDSYGSTPIGIRKSSTNEFDFNIGKTDKTLPPVTERTTITAALPTTELFNVGKTDKSIQPIAIVTNEEVISRGSAAIPDENSFNVGAVSVTPSSVESSTKRIIDHATVYGTFAKGSTTPIPPSEKLESETPISSIPPVSYEAQIRAQQLSKPRLILTKVPQNLNLNPNLRFNGFQSTVSPANFGFLPNGQIVSLSPPGPGLTLQNLLLAKQLQQSSLNPSISVNNMQSTLGAVQPTQPTPRLEETTPLPVAISTVDTVSPEQFFSTIKGGVENIDLIYNKRVTDEVVKPRPFQPTAKHEAITRSPKIDYSGSNKLNIDITPTTPTYKISSASPFAATTTEISTSPGSTLPTLLPKFSSAVNENIDNMINALMKITDDEDRSSETPRPGLIVPPSAGPQTLHTLAVYFANALDGIVEEKGMKGRNLDEAEKERLTALLTQMTMNRYNELFPEQTESTPTKDKAVETSTLSTRDASDDEENDLEGQHSKNPVQTPKVRQLAKVFTQALSAYLEDPHSFKKVLHDVRPTEPPSSPQVEDTTSPDDELLNFSDADSKSSYPPIFPTNPSARPTWGYILALNNTPNLSVDDKNSLSPDENLQGADSQSFVPQYNNLNVKEDKATSFTTARTVGGKKSETPQFKFSFGSKIQKPSNFGFTTARSVDGKKLQLPANHWTASPDATKLWQTSLSVNPADINNDFKTTESSLYINVEDTKEEIVPDKSSATLDQQPHTEIKYELRTLPKLALNSSQVHGILIDFMNTTKSDETNRLQRILRKLNTTEDEFLSKMREIEGNPLTRRLILLLISECGVNATKDIQTRAVPLEQLIKLSATNAQGTLPVEKSETLQTSSSSSPYASSRVHLSNPPAPSKSSSGFKTLVDPSLKDDDEDTRALQLLNSLYSIASRFG